MTLQWSSHVWPWLHPPLTGCQTGGGRRCRCPAHPWESCSPFSPGASSSSLWPSEEEEIVWATREVGHCVCRSKLNTMWWKQHGWATPSLTATYLLPCFRHVCIVLFFFQQLEQILSSRLQLFALRLLARVVRENLCRGKWMLDSLIRLWCTRLKELFIKRARRIWILGGWYRVKTKYKCMYIFFLICNDF